MSAPSVEDTVGTRLLKAMLTELQMLSPRYSAMDEEHQSEIIDRLRGQIQEELRGAIDAIAAKHYQSVTAILQGVAFGEKVSKLKLVTPSGSKGLHALADLLVHGKGACMTVLADLDQFTGGMEGIKPTTKQRDWTQPDRDDE